VGRKPSFQPTPTCLRVGVYNYFVSIYWRRHWKATFVLGIILFLYNIWESSKECAGSLFIGGCELGSYLSLAVSVLLVFNFILLGAVFGVAENKIERAGRTFKIFLYFLMIGLAFVLIFPETILILFLLS